MSQQELEHGDQEVMDVVNGHSHPDASATAESIAKATQQGEKDSTALGMKEGNGFLGCARNDRERISPCPSTSLGVSRNDKAEGCGQSSGADRIVVCAGAEAKRQILWTVLQVLCCILVAALFVAALLDPGFVVHLANVGILASSIVAAVIVDRRLRRR